MALAYHQRGPARLGQGDVHIAADIVCDAPAGRIEGAEAYRGFIGPFAQMLMRPRMIAAFGDDETALIMYDTETASSRAAPGAECVTVKDGKIIYSRFIFDRVPSTPPVERRRVPHRLPLARDRHVVLMSTQDGCPDIHS